MFGRRPVLPLPAVDRERTPTSYGPVTRVLLTVSPEKPIVLSAGPEAGFSTLEEALLVRAGFVPVHLGPRVLRSETAGPAALAALNALFGDA